MHSRIETQVNIYDVTMDVSGYYTPEEPRVWYDGNMEGYPGAAAEFELASVKVEDVEIIDLISDQIYDEIIDKVIENQQS
jgi:hypothetical protein